MSNTKATRRGDLRSYASTYKIPVRLSQGELDQCVDFGKYDVFFDIFPEYHHLFRVTGDTFSDGDPWPDGGLTSSESSYFFGLAGRYYMSGTPNLPIRFARPSMKPMLVRNTRIAATAAEPALLLYDHKFHFLPNTITGASLEYFAYPAPLADPSVLDSATDTMPLNSEPDITRAAFERMLKMLLSQQVAVQLTQQEIQRTEETLRELYEKKFGVVNQQPKEDA